MRALAARPSPEAALPEGRLVAPAGHIVEPGPHHLPRQRDVLGGTHGMSTAQLPADHRCFCQRPLLVAHVSPLLLVPDQHHPVARAVSVPQPQVTRSAYRGQASLRGDQNRLRGAEGELAPAGRYEDTCVCPGATSKVLLRGLSAKSGPPPPQYMQSRKMTGSQRDPPTAPMRPCVLASTVPLSPNPRPPGAPTMG